MFNFENHEWLTSWNITCLSQLTSYLQKWIDIEWINFRKEHALGKVFVYLDAGFLFHSNAKGVVIFYV